MQLEFWWTYWASFVANFSRKGHLDEWFGKEIPHQKYTSIQV